MPWGQMMGNGTTYQAEAMPWQKKKRLGHGLYCPLIQSWGTLSLVHQGQDEEDAGQGVKSPILAQPITS